MKKWKVCVVIPVYNHQQAISLVVEALKPMGLFCLLINDGSSAECSAILNKIAQQESEWLNLYERAENGGKGAAVKDGLQLAYRQGYTHAIQIDSDGQHNLEDINQFIQASQQSPEKLILGYPHFDQTAPKKRLYGRWLTNIWIWINTLSFAIKDGMCGFRCYPLAAVETLLRSTDLGDKMDFDIEIVVRLYWQGLDVINIPTKVQYPTDGISHFNLLQDNLLISRKHAQLFFEMFRRVPALLIRKFK